MHSEDDFDDPAAIVNRKPWSRSHVPPVVSTRCATPVVTIPCRTRATSRPRYGAWPEQSRASPPRREHTVTEAPLLTDQPWFTRTALMMTDHTLHGRREEARRLEAALIRQLTLHLLNAERADPDYPHAATLSFYGFCQRNIHRSHAQILQDLWVLYMTGEKRGGFFVEFGACDGRLLSNTRLLEEGYGWTGILAEPNPVWHASLAANRASRISPLCVAAESGRKVEFISTDRMPELSRMADIVPSDVHERNGNRAEQTRFQVETVSLLDLLRSHDAPALVDYLSVDTEGSEYEILRAFDFDAFRFRLISVEHAGEAEKRENIRLLLESRGYARWMPDLSRWDDWYVDCR